jgi:RNA-directed DNA polymerase
MKPDQAHRAQIQAQFAALRTKQDIVKMLSDARCMLLGRECEPFELKTFTYYCNPANCRERYKTFLVKKKSGGVRTIHAPVRGLKSLLRAFNYVLQCLYEPHEAATGFVLGKSIADNARLHLKRHYVLNLDLKDFFHSFDLYAVKRALMRAPFNLRDEREELAFFLASLCTHPFEIDGELQTVLPQGSPCSPTLTNILCKRLDEKLSDLARETGVTYSRYADDITFSSYHNALNNASFIKEMHRIIEGGELLRINPKKTRLQKAGYRQEVTGLTVNEKPNVKRVYVKQLRMWLHYWEKYGAERAEQIFQRDYRKDKGHVKTLPAKFINVLDGKLEFMKMVKGEGDATYLGLKSRFERLVYNQQNKSISRMSMFISVINELKNNGIDSAMSLYEQTKKAKHESPK